MDMCTRFDLNVMKEVILQELSSKMEAMEQRLRQPMEEILTRVTKLEGIVGHERMNSNLDLVTIMHILQDIKGSLPSLPKQCTPISPLPSSPTTPRLEEEEKKPDKPPLSKRTSLIAAKLLEDDIPPIEAKTQEEEEALLRMEMEVLVDSKTLDSGATLQNRNLDMLQNGILTFPGIKTVSAQISNYLDVLLVNPEFFVKGQMDGDCRPGLTPYSIGSCEKEALLFHDQFTLDLEGVFTYQIGNTNLRLATLFAVLNDASTWLFGVGFIPRSVSANLELYNFLCSAPGLNPVRPDLKFAPILNSDMKELLATHGNFSARVTFEPGRKVLMNVEIVEIRRKPPNNSVKSLLHVKEGHTFGGGETVEGIAASVPSKSFGCVIELANGLRTALVDFQHYIVEDTNGRIPAEYRPPYRIESQTKEVICFSDSRNIEGVISYKLHSTDLRLAIAFRIHFGGNSFAVAFVPSNFWPDSLLSPMMDSNQWQTHPNQKFSVAKDGERVAEIRNIRARAGMTENASSILRVAVSTF